MGVEARRVSGVTLWRGGLWRRIFADEKKKVEFQERSVQEEYTTDGTMDGFDDMEEVPRGFVYVCENLGKITVSGLEY